MARDWSQEYFDIPDFPAPSEKGGAETPTLPLGSSGRALEGLAAIHLDLDAREQPAILQNGLQEKGQILLEAHAIVNGSRHGTPERMLEDIASLWSAHLKLSLSPRDVANMMVLLKVARAGASHSVDNYTDIAGYAALAAEELDNG